MNWLITTATMPHTEYAGRTLEIDITGNENDVITRLFNTVCLITPRNEEAVATCEDGRVIRAIWNMYRGTVIFSDDHGVFAEA